MASECVISISSMGSFYAREAHRTELQAFCSESLRAWGIIDFPKSQFKPISQEKKKIVKKMSAFAQNPGCSHITKSSVRAKVKRSFNP